MRKLKIEDIDAKVVNSVHLTLRVDQDLVYIMAENRQGFRTISVRFELSIPYVLNHTSFDAPNENMDAEEVKNRVLDWLLTEEGAMATENAFGQHRAVKAYG